ncbi:MAG: sodium:solute symporter family protein [Candidatus Woesearchaeota archaeon]|jgi:Na+/proline symporter
MQNINMTLIILISYFVLMLIITWYFSRAQSLETYFINKRKTSLWLMVFCTVSTIVGATATISVVSEVSNSGISYGLVLLIAFMVGVLVLALVAKKMKSFGDKYGAYSIADIFHGRFDKKNHILVSILQLFILIGWIATNIAGISIISSLVLGVNYGLAIAVAVLITIIYSAIGGLKADIMTDFVQFWVILIPFIVMFFLGYAKIGSISNLVHKLPEGHLNLFNFGGIAWFLGTILLSGFIFLGTAYHWQRTLSAENEKVARNSYFLSIPFLFIIGIMIIFFGLLSSVLLKNTLQDFAIFNLMSYLLPPSLTGLGFAAILAAIMSSVDSSMVAGSTIIYKLMYKDKLKNKISIDVKSGIENKHIKNEKKRVLIARIITAGFGIIAGGIVLIIPSIVSLSLLVSYMTLIFVPAILAALYSKKTSANASFYSILLGFSLLIILFPVLGKNAFIIPVLMATSIVLFYDKVFKKK